MTQTHKACWKAGLTVALSILPMLASRAIMRVSDDGDRLSWELGLIVAAIALSGYLLQGMPLGIVAGILIGLHPRLFEDPLWGTNVRLADTCVFLTAALVLLALRQSQETKFVWWKWLLLFAGLVFSVGFAWRLGRLTGLQAAVSVFALLGIVAPLTRVVGALRCSWFNLIVLTSLGLLAPVAAFGIAQDFTTFDSEYWHMPDWSVVAETWRTGLESTFFVSWWIAVPFLLWAWWRSVRRGWRSVSRGDAPLTWTVSCFSLLAGLAPFFATSPSSTFPAIMIWSIFLLVFLVFDILQAVGERLVLQPPEPQK